MLDPNLSRMFYMSRIFYMESHAMYEFTMGGWWFRWSALDNVSRRLAGESIALAFVASLPLGLAFGRYAYILGQCAGSEDWSPCANAEVSLAPLLAVLAIMCGIASGLLWARFSARQDEMFNRVQNWALGMGGAWTGAAIALWATLALGGLAPSLTLAAGALLFVALTAVFWWIAVRRWAY